MKSKIVILILSFVFIFSLSYYMPYPVKAAEIIYSEAYETPHPLAHNSLYWHYFEDQKSSSSDLHTTKIRLHFSSYDMETNYDYIRIYDARDNLVQSFTGQGSNVYSNWIDGNSAVVEAITDFSVSSWGYKVDYIEVMTEYNETPPSTGTTFNPPTRMPINGYYDLNRTVGSVSDYTGMSYSGSELYWPYAYDQHSGTDYNDEGTGTANGKNIYSTGYGKVIQAIDSTGNCGSYVSIDHGNGYKTNYCHMQSGSFVGKVIIGNYYPTGTLLGLVGKTGNVSGAHLHLSVINSQGNFIDPYSSGLIKPIYWYSEDLMGNNVKR